MLTKTEMGSIMQILKTAYPRYYQNTTKEEMASAINLWCEMFKDIDLLTLSIAVKSLIATFKYPPTIADIKDKIYELNTINEKSPIEIWNLVKKAICNSIYNSTEEFEKLPESAKKIIGSPNQLRDWAIATDYNDGVVRGQFLKQMEIIKQREKEESAMLPETKAILQKLNSDLKMLK